MTTPQLAGSAGRTADLYGPEGAAVYHDLSARDTGELRELLRAVRRLAGPVLDLAAGSGRLTLPLLATGREVTALELSDDLLGLLRARLLEAPPAVRARCTVVAGDMAAFAVHRQFGAVVLGTTSVSLLDPPQRAGLYRCVATHLRPGGRFLLTTRHRRPDAPDPADTETEVVGASGAAYRLGESWVGDRVRLVTVRPVDAGPDDPVLASLVRDLPADELVAELHAAGFVVRDSQALPAEPGWEHVLIAAEVRES